MAIINFEDYMHVGIIVNNIEETLEKMQKIFKIDEYRINLFPPENVNKDDIQLMYKGEKTWFTARFCFIKMGNSELELIEPLEGNSVWRDFLNEKGEGIHHLKFEVESLKETMDAFKEIGVECPQYGSAVGPNTGKIWAYFDTTKELGYVSEILNKKLWETL
ncbi:hypothetical protein AN642_00520 [Epulopiscium sp. SCG-B10WGA-EpuloA2]|nr:hypothetical protein AN641_01520 [Epulopiscium sp. SCG-C07WGA-EpuloA2]ONI46640.1 hypothetical protein AN642_00485 [Epulopiscium sp. SCG-B10WGA-EpuloA2]ONI46647.1 hypothetical protein AN642_00520 [Epulopiscium sp. SCG-B10WGA-EpuloA2]